MSDRAALPRTLALLDGWTARGAQLGGQLCVLVDGRAVVDTSFGEAAPGRPMARDGLALWLSSSKPLAAILIARAWERGAVELDSRVAELWPAFAAGGKHEITIRHLLTHTAGFRMPRLPWPDAEWNETLAAIAAGRLEPRWRPGRDAGYHMASSWFVLGELIRRLEGRPFEQVVREELLDPLGCRDSWVGMPAELWDRYGERILPMWNTESDPPRRHSWTEQTRLARSNPGANGCGPIRELAKVWEMLRRGGELGGVRILARTTTEALLARHRVGQLDRTFRLPLDWGLGVIPNSARSGEQAGDLPYHYGRHASIRAVGHSGARSSTAFCDPEHALTVALWLNGTPDEATHRARTNEVLAALYEELDLARPTPP